MSIQDNTTILGDTTPHQRNQIAELIDAGYVFYPDYALAERPDVIPDTAPVKAFVNFFVIEQDGATVRVPCSMISHDGVGFYALDVGNSIEEVKQMIRDRWPSYNSIIAVNIFDAGCLQPKSG